MQRKKITDMLSEIIEKIDSCDNGQRELFYNFIEHQLELAKIFISKQLDYGPDNIAKFGEIGIIIRMSDKFERLLNLTLSGSEERNEAIEDTYKDISVYAIIALFCRTGLWPGARKFLIRSRNTTE